MMMRQKLVRLFFVLLGVVVIFGLGGKYIIPYADAGFPRHATSEELRDNIMARNALRRYDHILATQATVAEARAKSAEDHAAGRLKTPIPNPVPKTDVNCNTVEGAKLCNDIKSFCDANGGKPGVCCGCTSEPNTCSIGC